MCLFTQRRAVPLFEVGNAQMRRHMEVSAQAPFYGHRQGNRMRSFAYASTWILLGREQSTSPL